MFPPETPHIHTQCPQHADLKPGRRAARSEAGEREQASSAGDSEVLLQRQQHSTGAALHALSWWEGGIPTAPAARTRALHRRRHRFNPWSGAKSLRAVKKRPKTKSKGKMVSFKLCVLYTHTHTPPAESFPGGTEDKNLPANASTGPVPGPGKAEQTCAPRACALHQVYSESTAPQEEPHPPQPESLHTARKTRCSQK